MKSIIVIFSEKKTGKTPATITLYSKLTQGSTMSVMPVIYSGKSVSVLSDGKKQLLQVCSQYNPDIVVCEMLTRNGFQDTVHSVASQYDYSIIWTRHYYQDCHHVQNDEKLLNDAFADAMIDLIHRL